MSKLPGRIVALALGTSVLQNSHACGWDGCLFSRPGEFASNAARDAQNVAQANIQESIAIVKAMSQGDVNEAVSHVGRLVVEGECLGCKQAITQLGGDASVATVEQMVTLGFMAMTDLEVGPIFITYDAKDKKSFVSKPTAADPHVFHAKGRAAKSPPQSFASITPALCIVQSTNKRGVVAGFHEPPQVKNLTTNAVAGWFDSTLKPGDKLSITAPVCPSENSKKNHQISVASVNMIFVKDTPVQRTGQQIHYELIGRQSR